MTAINFRSVGLPLEIVAPNCEARPAALVAFTEGPAASADGFVYFTDLMNNRILRYDSKSRNFSVFRQPSGRANGLLFDVQGRLLACEGNEFGPNDGNRRITRTDLATGNVEVLTDRYEGKRYNAPNDIACHTNGTLFFTDPCYGDRATMELDHESVYRISSDGKVTRVLTNSDIDRPNGIAFSPDEKSLYVVDACPVEGGNRKIWAFELGDDMQPRNRRLVFDFAPGRGGDGMAVDSRGNLYIAGGVNRPRTKFETDDVPPSIWVITPQGKLLGRIPIPEDVLTNVTFGGEDLKTLYITAGKTLFQVRVNVPGYVVHRRG